MIDELLRIALTMLLLIILWRWFFYTYRDYRVDLLRQRLFKIRDELFMKAEQGEISFDDNAYGMARTTLNGMIRFAHEVSFLRFLIGYIVHRCAHDSTLMHDYTTRWRENIEALPAPAQKLILNAYMEMHIAALAHIVHTSIIGFVLLVPVWHLLQLVHLTKRLPARPITIAGSTTWQLVDAEANAIGASLDAPKDWPIAA